MCFGRMTPFRARSRVYLGTSDDEETHEKCPELWLTYKI